MPGDEPTILLVSMCGTPEEFLAAFRRYVDRHGLFIPTASPPAAGQRGRFAVTLIDGGVLIEGVAEIISSSPRPSALHGRTGMVLSFGEIDEESREVLATLEKAKLSLKATNLGAHLVARPSVLRDPVTHPEVRLPSAASDRAMALAECVLLGDVSSLSPTGRRAPTAKPVATVVPTRASPRIAAPAVNAAPPEVAVGAPSPAMDASPAAGLVAERPSDVAGEATEVGPIVLDMQSQPSGPTLTNPAIGAAGGASGVLVDPDFETTIGGPPPIPARSPAPVAAEERPSARAIASARAGTDSTIRAVSRQDAPAPAGAPAEPAPEPTAASERRPSLPAIPRTLTPIPSPSSSVAAPPSGPTRAPSPPSAALGPRSVALGPGPLPRAPSPAIPRTLTPAMALRNDTSAATRAPRGSTEAGIGSQPLRAPDRAPPIVRKTSIGIAAVHVEPAPSAPVEAPAQVARPGVDVAAVPQIIHDSMFVTEDATDESAQEAVPVASEHQATRREGQPRVPPRAPAPLATPALPGVAAATRSGAVAAPANKAVSGPAVAARALSPNGGPLPQPPPPPSATPPTGAIEHEVPARLGRSSAPLDVPREPGEAASAHDELATELTPSLLDSGPSEAGRVEPERPSQPTVPIRPPQAVALVASRESGKLDAPPPSGSPAATPGSGPTARPSSNPIAHSGSGPVAHPGSGPVARPGSGPVARPGSGPVARPGSARDLRPAGALSPADLLAAGAAAPTSLDDAGFATVPTSMPPTFAPGVAHDAQAQSAAAALRSLGLGDESSGPGAEATPAPPQRKSQPELPMRRSQPAISFSPAPANASPFSDPGSISAPLVAAAAPRPEVLSFDATPAAPWSEPASEPSADHSARHQRPRSAEMQPALGPKIEIDPALYAESAIDRSFEHNFVVPGAEPRAWQEVPTPWSSPPSGPVAAPPAPPAPYAYQPYPGYDPSYPMNISSGDETALVTAPGVRRSRTMVIVGSAILVILLGLGLYLYWDATKDVVKPAAPTPAVAPPASSTPPESDHKLSTAPTSGGEPSAPSAPTAPASGGEPSAPSAPTAPTSGGEPSAPSAATADCKVTLVSTPAGATVSLGDDELGTTPLTTTVPCAGGTFTFKKAGSADQSSALDALRDGQEIAVTLPPQKADRTKQQVEIEIVTTPVAARIRVNNKEVGRSPVKLTVPAGVTLLLSAVKDGRAASVKVTPTEQQRSFTLDLKRTSRTPRKSNDPPAPGLDGI